MPTSQGAAVEHQQTAAPNSARHMRGRGRADAAKAVGARPRHARHAELGAGGEQGLRHRMRRAAQAESSALAAGRGRGHALDGGGTMRVSGPGQKAAARRCGQRVASRRRKGLRMPRRPDDMHDQRMLDWAGPWRRRPWPRPHRHRRGRRGHRRFRSGRRPVRPPRGAALAACIASDCRNHRDARQDRAGRPSKEATCKAAARALAASAAVIVRWPILRPRRALTLPYRCRWVPGSASIIFPRRACAFCGPPRSNQRSPSRLSITAHSSADVARPAAGRPGNAPGARTAIRRRRRCCSGRSCGGAAPSRWRPGEPSGEDKEFDAEHADIAHLVREPGARRRVRRLAASAGAMSGAGTCVTARMPSRCRFCCTGRWTTVAVGAAGDDHAQLMRASGRQFFEHAGHALQLRRQAAASAARSATRHLALAVVAQARRSSGCRAGGRRRCFARSALGLDQGPRRAGDAAFLEVAASRPPGPDTPPRTRRPVPPAGGRRACTRAGAGTFSNSVVIACAALHQLRQARLHRGTSRPST